MINRGLSLTAILTATTFCAAAPIDLPPSIAGQRLRAFFAGISQIPCLNRRSYLNGLLDSTDNGPCRHESHRFPAPTCQSLPRHLRNNDFVPFRRSMIP